jgi:hypothetical protein
VDLSSKKGETEEHIRLIMFQLLATTTTNRNIQPTRNKKFRQTTMDRAEARRVLGLAPAYNNVSGAFACPACLLNCLKVGISLSPVFFALCPLSWQVTEEFMEQCGLHDGGICDGPDKPKNYFARSFVENKP